jgi:3-hydroxymyristoyl/3-hydroxydecanoyl-(acyl carrier protein) dehydratase
MEMIERLIPHRPPFLLLDAIDRVDLKGARLRARRFIDPSDVVFRGHFPGEPVYPGVLHLEMVGQAACCLASLLVNRTDNPTKVEAPVRVRATHVHRAVMFAPIGPSETTSIHVAVVYLSELSVCAAGQVYVDDRLCSVCLLEACFLD